MVKIFDYFDMASEAGFVVPMILVGAAKVWL
jgi:hypothetical protein